MLWDSINVGKKCVGRLTASHFIFNLVDEFAINSVVFRALCRFQQMQHQNVQLIAVVTLQQLMCRVTHD
jgi:hypothetical protein